VALSVLNLPVLGVSSQSWYRCLAHGGFVLRRNRFVTTKGCAHSVHSGTLAKTG